MTEEQIESIIKDEVTYLQWNFEECMESLAKLSFTIEKVKGNSLYDESKVRNTVAMAYHAFGS